MIKGCNIFGVKNWQTLAALWTGALSCNKKNFESRTQLGEPAECSSRGDLLLLYKILHLLFSLWYKLFVHYALRVQKITNMTLMWGLWNFSFRTLLLCFGVRGKTPGLISCSNFVLKKLSASAMVLMSWKDVTRSSLCSGVKECGTKRAHNFLFPKSSFRIRRTTVLGMFKDSAIIL